MFSATKDRITCMAAKAFLEAHLKNYGEIESLTIDSQERRLEVVGQLRGELSPVRITINRYVLEQKGGAVWLTVRESSASRPWLAAVMRDHLEGRTFELPAWAAAAL